VKAGALVEVKLRNHARKLARDAIVGREGEGREGKGREVVATFRELFLLRGVIKWRRRLK
jgi:hypothetical protein